MRLLQGEQEFGMSQTSQVLLWGKQLSNNRGVGAVSKYTADLRRECHLPSESRRPLL